MRDYAKLAPTFWTGTTGKVLRKKGPEAVVVALYLVSAPGSNMLGLYYQPLLFMAHETGLGIEGASKGLQGCIEAGFCSYDEESEMVFVHEMAAWQIADELSSKDLRCKGIQRDYDALPDCPFLGAWYERYAPVFHLTRRRESGAKSSTPAQAPSKPLRSQEQEQEQEQETMVAPADAAPTVPKAAPPLKAKDLEAQGVLAQHAADWLALRRAKRLPLTPTAWADTVLEGRKAGLDPAKTVAKAVANNWAGFKASWLANGPGGKPPPSGPSASDPFAGCQ
jgi:hypothetical protein